MRFEERRARFPLTLIATLALRGLRRNLRRSVLTLGAITVGVWSSVVLASLSRGMAHQMAQDAILNFTGHLQIHAPGYIDDPVINQRFTDPPAELLDQNAAVQAWSPRIRVPAAVRSEREVYGVTLLGIDPARERGNSFLAAAIVAGKFLESGSDAGVLVGQKLLEQLQTKPGRRVVVMSEGADGEVADRGFRISGVFDAELESTEKNYVITGIETARAMLGTPGETSEIAVTLRDERSLETEAAKLRAALPELDIQPWTAVQPLVKAMLDLTGGFLAIWFCIVMLTIGFGLINTIFMSIFERTRELGLVQALGMRPGLVVAEVIAESFFLVLGGVAAGNTLAFATIFLLRDGIDLAAFSSATEYVGMSNVIKPHIYLWDWILASSLITIIGIFGSIYPGWKASRANPIESLARG